MCDVVGLNVQQVEYELPKIYSIKKNVAVDVALQATVTEQ